MTERYGAITTATLAALLLGTAPAMAQISKGLDANAGAGATVGADKSDGNVSSPTNQANPNAGVSSTDAIAGAKKSNQDVTNPSSTDSSGSVKSDESASGTLKSDQSPSASPSMGDDKAISNQDDRDQMKQQEQIDKKTGLDRADQAAGPHGAEGRANARTRGSQQ